jgi:hypothetical protein
MTTIALTTTHPAETFVGLADRVVDSLDEIEVAQLAAMGGVRTVMMVFGMSERWGSANVVSYPIIPSYFACLKALYTTSI